MFEELILSKEEKYVVVIRELGKVICETLVLDNGYVPESLIDIKQRGRYLILSKAMQLDRAIMTNQLGLVIIPLIIGLDNSDKPKNIEVDTKDVIAVMNADKEIANLYQQKLSNIKIPSLNIQNVKGAVS
jgi:hypothetical protein